MKIRQQVIDTITDNLRILDIAEEIIYILPIRYFSRDSNQLAYKAGMQAFLSLFDKEYNFEEYKQKFRSINDIKKNICVQALIGVLFSQKMKIYQLL